MPYLYSAMHAGASTRMRRCWRRPSSRFEDDPACFADADALMFGPCLLAAPVTAEGAREVDVYLPRGPESWRDFCDGAVYAAGRARRRARRRSTGCRCSRRRARSSPTTDSGDDYSRLHDEPSRALRLFPGPAAGRLREPCSIEDDGVSAGGPLTTLAIALSWTSREIELAVSIAGDFALPYRAMRVLLPEDERRPLRLTCVETSGRRENAIALTR